MTVRDRDTLQQERVAADRVRGDHRSERLASDDARLSLERLRREGEAFMEELSREYYLAHSGHKATRRAAADLREARGDPRATTRSTLALEAFRGAPEGSEEQRSARLLLDWQAESQSARELARARRARDRVGGVGGRATSPTAARSSTSAWRSRSANSTDARERACDRGGARDARRARAGADAARAVPARARHHRAARARRRATTRRSSC